jgi:1,4-alpha-glucan branching enzyme
MWGHPGKKLLFMGGEFAQAREWNHDVELDWSLLAEPGHAGVQHLLRDLNRIYRSLNCLHSHDCEGRGFRWIDCNDNEQSVLAWRRIGDEAHDFAVIVCNFTPVPRHDYRIGVPRSGYWRELMNTDAAVYGGSNLGNAGGVETEPRADHGHDQSVSLTLPPLSTLFLVHEEQP